ncbi:hypothetical protein UACE39S_00647 [Ureibacillus acetophenoni]
MYFYHPSDYNQHYIARHSMYGAVPYTPANNSIMNQPTYWNGYPHSISSSYNPNNYQGIAQRNVQQQQPTHPAQQPNRQRQQNQGSNTHYQYPPVDETLISQSANETRKLMADASLVLERFASSKDFDRRLMELAQQSRQAEVEQLIKSIGVKSDVKVKFNPDGLSLEFSSKLAHTKCCQLEINLRWR